MNKSNKKLLILALTLIIGGGFAIYSVQAQNNELILEAAEECNIQYTGDSCAAELKLINSTGEVLAGEVFLHIDYRGICGDGFFDGEGIEARFSINNDNWLNFSGWEEGTTAVSGFSIAEGEIQPKLKIETHPALCPGEYIFSLKLKGTTEEGEEILTPPTPIGGSRGGYSFTKIEEEEEEPAQISEEIEAGEEEEEEEIIVVEGETEEGVGEEEEEEEKPASVEAAAGEEEEGIIEEEGEETGMDLGALLAAIGNLFRLENLWWLLLFLIIIIIILFFLSRKKKRKGE